MTKLQTTDIPSSSESQDSFSTISGFVGFLQALGVSSLIFCVIITFVFPEQNQQFILYDAGLFSGLIFLFLINSQLGISKKGANFNLKRKAGLYTNLLPKKDAADSLSDGFAESREKALEYCQNLIQDYIKVRQISRNLYYIFQLSTIVLSGVTPIFVLVDKQVDVPYLTWLPVVLPAVASVISSVSTSFPFQERWVNANRIVEKLEAEQEKFILGVTPLYRAFKSETSNDERNKKLKLSIENFIVEVNKIHLQQVDSSSSKSEMDDASGGGERGNIEN